MDDLLTIDEVCQELGIKPARLRQLRQAGVIDADRWIGQSPLYARADVEKAKSRDRGTWADRKPKKRRKK